MRPRHTPLLLGLIVAACLAAAPAASAKTTWLCFPGKKDACAQSLSTTLVSPAGQSLGRISPRADRPRRVDCFYVYPTVSDQKSINATTRIDTEQREIARFQAARYSQHCRVFAPVYPQVTLQGIADRKVPASAARKAYAGVLSAWKTYLRRYNKGRGVVLIGHSQGAGVLSALVRREIDPSARERRRLIAAYLFGGQVTVKKGSDRGGSFRNVRACRSAKQVGCVIAFSTYNQTPPADSLFGRSTGRLSSLFLKPYSKSAEVLCTNPAALRGGSALLDTIVPSVPFSTSTTIGVGNTLVGFPVPSVPTTYVEARRTFRGRCSSAGGARTLQATSEPGAPVPKPVPDATWGLHLLDANIALGDQVGLVASQGKSWLRRETARHVKRKANTARR